MGGGEFFHFAVIAVENFLLEMLGIGAGIMFSALQAHFDPAHVQVAVLFFDLPSACGEITQVIIEIVADAVIQEPFGATFEQRWLGRRCCGTVTMAVLGIPGGGPIVGIEELGQAAVAAGRYEG